VAEIELKNSKGEREPLARCAKHFLGTWSIEIKHNGTVLMLADEKQTHFGPGELDEFFAARFLFLASDSLSPMKCY